MGSQTVSRKSASRKPCREVLVQHAPPIISATWHCVLAGSGSCEAAMTTVTCWPCQGYTAGAHRETQRQEAVAAMSSVGCEGFFERTSSGRCEAKGEGGGAGEWYSGSQGSHGVFNTAAGGGGRWLNGRGGRGGRRSPSGPASPAALTSCGAPGAAPAGTQSRRWSAGT